MSRPGHKGKVMPPTFGAMHVVLDVADLVHSYEVNELKETLDVLLCETNMVKSLSETLMNNFI